MSSSTFDVQEKQLPPLVVAGIRMKGRYSDCGKAFGKICRLLKWRAKGPPMMLHYDTCYKEADADFEACVPMGAAEKLEGVEVHDLPGGKCVSLVHQGPYEQLGSSYERIGKYLSEHGYKAAIPSREIYIKGPGMIFKGNPKRYLTEIQMLIEPAS
jgi:effector-binding domain-containing protein